MNNDPSIQPNNNPQTPKKHRRLPNAGSFQKGRSGNRKGRPPGTGKEAAKGADYQVLLNKTVTTTIHGKVREMSLEEAIQHRTFKDALAGKPKAVRQVLEWIRERDVWIKKHQPGRPSQSMIPREFSPDPHNADPALLLLDVARIDQYRASWNTLKRTPLLIQPWAVELALRRNRQGAEFSERDWDTVKRCTQELRSSASATSQSSAGPHEEP